MSLSTPVLKNPRKAGTSGSDDARYAALVDQMVDGLFVADASGRYIEVNRAGCEMLGYSREEVLSMSIPDVVAGEEIERVYPEVQRLSVDGVVRSEWHFRRKDGSLFIGEVLGRRLPDGCVQAILRDVSASRAVEESLREAEERHRIALSAAELGTWSHDIAAGTMQLDAMAQAHTGIAMDIAPAEAVFAQFHPDDTARMKEVIAVTLDPARSTGGTANDFRFVAPDGSVRWLRVHAHVEFEGAGKDRRPVQVVGTMEDITARKRAQERLVTLSKAYAMRSEINKCVARAVDEYELLSEACRISVQHLGFRLIRIIGVEDNPSLAVLPVAYSPAPAAIAGIAAPEWDAAQLTRLRALAHSNAGRCLVLGSGAVAETGTACACICPLHVDGKFAGAMIFHSSDTECFDAETTRLLEEMAADISFGLSSLAEARRLHESEQRFSTIFRSSPNCILIVRISDDCIIDANDGFLRTFGYRRDEVVGRTIPAIGLWQSEEVRHAVCTVLERDGRIRDVEAIWRNRSGEVRDCLVSGEIVLLGGARHLSCVVTDITERRAVDRLLYAREQEFRALAENSPDIISRFDRDGRRIYVNAEMLRCFGVSLTQALGKTPGESLPGSLAARQIQDAVEAVVATAQETEMDVSTNEGADGQLVDRHVRMVPEFDAEGRVASVLAIARDITRLKEAKRRLRETQDQLRELDVRREHAREDERKRMAREIHDVLGQLLTALRLDIDMMGMEFGVQEPMLLERTARAMRLVDDTITVVRSLASALRPPVLDMGIVSALEWLSKEFGGHGVVCEVMVRESEIDFDEVQATEVFRIVQESLTNVARHARARRATIDLHRSGGGYQLAISDDGVGFDPEVVGKHSLGLVGMRERAARLGGELFVQSGHGAGTRILARLPLKRCEETS